MASRPGYLGWGKNEPPKLIRESYWATASWELGEQEDLDMKHRIESGETRKEGESGGVPRSMGTWVLCGRSLQFGWAGKRAVRVSWFRYTVNGDRSLEGLSSCGCFSIYCWGPEARSRWEGFGREGSGGEHSLLIKPFLQQSRGWIQRRGHSHKDHQELVEPFRKERIRADNSRKEQEKDIPARGITDSELEKKKWIKPD